MFDIAQEFVTPHTVLGRCDEVGRKLLPLFTQLLQVVADVAVYPAAFQFVGFGENDGEGYSVLAQPFYESEVYGLRLVTAVDEDKEAGHLLALQNVGLYDALNLFLAFLSALGIAVARKVDDVPVLINQEMIDEMVFPGVADVMASPLRPVSMLMRLDFPTLERPMKAYSGNVPPGHFLTSVLLMTNSALVISILLLVFCCFFMQR